MTLTRLRRLLMSLLLLAFVPVAAVADDPVSALPGETSPSITSEILEGPPGSVAFGGEVLVLANGNYAVADERWTNSAGDEVGAVHLYDGRSDTLISSLTGSRDGDGDFIELLEVGDSNLVARWTQWNANGGAVSWIDGTVGLSGVVSDANSLVGSPGSFVAQSIKILRSGDYVVVSQNWEHEGTGEFGAATFARGDKGIVGRPSAAISLVGSGKGDFSGFSVTELTNGNFVIVTPDWTNGPNDEAGAATWARAGVGVVGRISPSISLVGSQPEDGYGMKVVPLANGNYVVASIGWSNGPIEAVGAATWADGTVGLTGAIDASNSLVGSTANDEVGRLIVPLAGGDYLSAQPSWDRSVSNQDAGAVTWVRGDGPTSAVVSTENSIYGKADDQIGFEVDALDNGHALIRSERFSIGFASRVGAITWMDGTRTTSAQVTTANSIVGSTSNDHVGQALALLTDGNAVVVSPRWDDGPVADVGAVTWISGAGPTIGTVSASNSLIGSSENDGVGGTRGPAINSLAHVLAVEGGHYVVGSALWDGSDGAEDVGAATWGTAGTGAIGRIGAGNSVIGASAEDRVGERLVPAAPGSAFVVSNDWSLDSGAVTWMSDTHRPVGPVSESNSFVGGPSERLAAVWLGLGSGDLMVAVPEFETGGVVVGGVAWIDGSRPRLGTVAISDVVRGREEGDFIGARLGNLDTGDVLLVLNRFNSDSGPDSGAVALVLPGPGMSGVVGPQNVAIGVWVGNFRNEVFRLTASDSVVLPLTNGALPSPIGVLLVRLDRPPRFEAIPDDVSAVASSGASETSVNFKTPAAVDVRDGLVRSVCVPASGAVFPVGETEVSCVATDAAGFSVSTGFTVTVTRRVAIESIVPARLLDTRPAGVTVDGEFAGVGRLDAGGEIVLQLSGRAGLAPDQSAGVVLNVTMIRPDGNGFVTVHPCGERPVASSLNAPGGGGVVANEIIAMPDVGGRVCLYSSVATDLAVDLTGFAVSGDGLRTLAPARLVDTRVSGATIDGDFDGGGRVGAGGTLEVAVLDRAGVPSDGVGSVVLNVTMIRPDGNGFVTVFPCGDRPLASSMNAPNGGGVVANEVIAKVSAAGTVCLFSSVGTDLAADVTGYVPESSGVVSLSPGRVLDTRANGETVDGVSAKLGRVGAGETVELRVLGRADVPASGVGSVVLNVTMIRPDGNGFVSIFPCGDRPNASSMNAPNGGGVVANEVIAKVSGTGTVCLFSSVGTDLAADVTGYITAA